MTDVITAEMSAQKLLGLADGLLAEMAGLRAAFATSPATLDWLEGQCKSLDRLICAICDEQVAADQQRLAIHQLADIVRRARQRLEELQQRREQMLARRRPGPPLDKRPLVANQSKLEALERRYSKPRRH